MKVKKEVFKQIVKECLIEILAEGLSARPSEMKVQEDKKNDTLHQKVDQANLKSKYSKNQTYSQNKPKNEISENRSIRKNPAYENAVQILAQSRPDFAGIFEDTARHTLQEQNRAENSSFYQTRLTDSAAAAVDSSSPEELFGEESASKWAELAFAPSINRKMA